jgi:predicted RNase H-like HicB family nuclease
MTILDVPPIINTTADSLVLHSGNRSVLGSAKKFRVSISGKKSQLESGSYGALPVQGQSFIVQSLKPPLNVLKPFNIVIELIDDGFVSSFTEANIHASGDTADEALDNLVAMIYDLYELFSNEVDQLGPEPSRQFSVLRTHLSL